MPDARHRQEKGQQRLGPYRPDELAALVAAITEENRHAEVGFGGPVGKE